MLRPVVYHDCQPIMDNIAWWSGVVGIACSPLSVVTAPGEVACAFSSGVLAGYLGQYWWYC